MYSREFRLKLRQARADARDAYKIACAIYESGAVTDPAALNAAREVYDAACKAYESEYEKYRAECISKFRLPDSDYTMPNLAAVREAVAAEKTALDSALDAVQATPRQRRRARAAMDRLITEAGNANLSAAVQGSALCAIY